jgi:hypothetical protein
MRPALDLVDHRVPRVRPTCLLHSSEAPQGTDLSRPLFTCTNANQAATCTCNTQPRFSPHHIVNHSSQPGATIHRSSDAPVLNGERALPIAFGREPPPHAATVGPTTLPYLPPLLRLRVVFLLSCPTLPSTAGLAPRPPLHCPRLAATVDE